MSGNESVDPNQYIDDYLRERMADLIRDRVAAMESERDAPNPRTLAEDAMKMAEQIWQEVQRPRAVDARGMTLPVMGVTLQLLENEPLQVRVVRALEMIFQVMFAGTTRCQVRGNQSGERGFVVTVEAPFYVVLNVWRRIEDTPRAAERVTNRDRARALWHTHVSTPNHRRVTTEEFRLQTYDHAGWIRWLSASEADMCYYTLRDFVMRFGSLTAFQGAMVTMAFNGNPPTFTATPAEGRQHRRVRIRDR